MMFMRQRKKKWQANIDKVNATYETKMNHNRVITKKKKKKKIVPLVKYGGKST